MSGAAPPTAVLGLDLELGEPWHRGAGQPSRALVQTYLLSSSVHPPPTAGGSRGPKTPLRLPSLVAAAKGPRRRSGMARFSLSEPSLLAPKANILFGGFSSSHHPTASQKQPPPPPPPFSKSSVLVSSRSGRLHQQQSLQEAQSCSRKAYIHFCQGIQLASRPRTARRHSHHPGLSAEMLQGDPQPSGVQHHGSLSQEGELLSVVGKPCLLSCSQRPAVAAGPARTQLHVFLPTEAEGEEVDSESVDEGFMDELDSKITSLKIQQRAPKAVTYH